MPTSDPTASYASYYTFNALVGFGTLVRACQQAMRAINQMPIY